MLDLKMRKAFENLVIRYRGITIKDIIDIGFSGFYTFNGDEILNVITGFGSCMCILCNTANCVFSNEMKKRCSVCYIALNGKKCFEEENAYSYNNISKASTPEGLLIAINERADHIELLLAEYDFRNKLAKEE